MSKIIEIKNRCKVAEQKFISEQNHFDNTKILWNDKVGVHAFDCVTEISKSWAKSLNIGFKSLNNALDVLNIISAEIGSVKNEIQDIKIELGNIEQIVKNTKENW